MHATIDQANLHTRQPALMEVPWHFAAIRSSPFMMEYLSNILRLCPDGERTLEFGTGSGYRAIWLSLRGVAAEGLDRSPFVVERARHANNIIGGNASFSVGDVFGLMPRGITNGIPHFRVIHHQGVLEHYTVPQIRAAIAQQVACAEWVVFSVPSVYYPFVPEVGDERLLPLEEWQRILAPFQIEHLDYRGDPQNGGKEHVLGILRGQEADDGLRNMMYPSEQPFPDGISAIVHTRNEASRIAECLDTLKGWADEIIVCDMESTDDTVEIASRYTDQIVRHPLISNFDRARNVSAMRARYKWVFYLDADERVPPGLGLALRQLIRSDGDNFEALLIPFRHFFAGRWMQALYPGYTSPRLFKNGKFVFNARLHAGAQVDGRITRFPADNPDLALVHYSYDSLGHYLEKMNRYTDGEAANMHQDGRPFHWQNAVRQFVGDLQSYYDYGRMPVDDVHGFIYSTLGGFYRFFQHAKLYERRYHGQQLSPEERSIPSSVEEMLGFALTVAREKPLPQAQPLRIDANAPDAAKVVWSGPLADPSGYGEESRSFLFALEQCGVPVAGQVIPWSQDDAGLAPSDLKRLASLTERPVSPGFVQIIQNFPPSFARHPDARIVIGRTMFETDRFPPSWVTACNQLECVWVPSEFNRESFARAGVDPSKLVVISGCLDAKPYLERIADPCNTIREIAADPRFKYLSVFDWTLHKGWDVLLRGS